MAAYTDLQQTALTVDEFIDFLDRHDDDEKWALVEGVPTMMTRGTRRHALLIGNIFAALRPLAKQHGREALMTEVLVSSLANVHFAAAPDIFVRCGPAAPLARKIEDPVLIFEVLSPSTMSFDRGYKFEQYASIPTLQQVVFVYQDELRVESWMRAEPQWTLNIVSDAGGAVHLPRFDAQLALGTIYEDAEL